MPKKEDLNSEIWCQVGITRNLGNYESLRLEAGARVTVEDVQSADSWAELWELVSEQINDQLKPDED